jgi:hypothetical protein
MITLKETHAAMMNNPAQWRIPLMDFVDDFRQQPNLLSLQEPFSLGAPLWMHCWLQQRNPYAENKTFPLHPGLNLFPLLRKLGLFQDLTA